MPTRVLALVVVCLAGCNHGPSFTSNCSVAATPAGATLPAAASGASAILPGGRQVTPAGTLLDVGGFPIGMRLLPGDRYAVVTDDAEGDQALRVVDLEALDPLHPVVSQVTFPLGDNKHASPGMLYGMALTSDGTRLYLSNGGFDPVDAALPAAMHYNTVQVFDLAGTPPQLTENKKLGPLQLMFVNATQRVPTGIALSGDGKLLYVACQVDNSLAILSLAGDASYGLEIGRAPIVGVGPYDVAVDESSQTAFVSLWGGDGRTNGIVPVDVSNATMPVAGATITTGRAAEAELLLAGRLYVANSGADTISIVDAASHAVRSMPATSGMILGASPESIAIEPAGANGGGRIYLANAGENAVVALDATTMSIVGRVPTAWYPTAVALRGDGTLVIAAARGLSVGPNDGTPLPPFAAGTLQVVARPSDDELAAGSRVVAANLERPHALEPKLTCAPNAPPSFPLPPTLGLPSAIKYVFLVIRENKTYDAVLGDLPGGNGDKKMIMFGSDVTPNAHALASEFVLLDNFYSHAELSVQGHEWTTSCIANDYTEKSWQHSDDYGRGYLTPVAWGPPSRLSNLAIPGSGDIWSHLDKAGVAYHNYGEVVNLGDAKTLEDVNYPGLFFDTNIDDNMKVDYVLSVITDPKYKVEPFSYFLLPNDHTNGTSKGAQTPQSMVANNDEATGRFIEGLSKSSLWPQSIVIVVEDDPGELYDHVEAHRSLCLVASPWVKRRYHSSTNFDLGSVYHTIELILGVGPMNLNDGHAAGMYELFSPTPDLTPFTHVPRKLPVAYNSADGPLARESAKIDWSKPDTADFSRILWKATHGATSEPPSRRRLTVRDDDGDGDGD